LNDPLLSHIPYRPGLFGESPRRDWPFIEAHSPTNSGNEWYFGLELGLRRCF
jgi:hypothetical protein